MSNQELDVTFGVEIECILAFHQSLLQKHLDRIGDSSSIIKTITDAQRVELRTNGMTYIRTRPMYMGWALTSECPLPAHRPPQRYDPYVDCHRDFGFRPYSDEIVHVAQTLLPGPPDVQSFRQQGKRMDFARWHLSEDASLLGVDKATMVAELRDRIGDANDWDSHGIELVSRILPPTQASYDEIAQHLAALRGMSSSLHGAIITPFCGLHVHVGLPPPAAAATTTTTSSFPAAAAAADDDDKQSPLLPTFDLVTLQHLAYMLVMYEHEISTMHASHRRAGSLASEIDIVTNLDIFAEETQNARRAAAAEEEDDFDWDSYNPAEDFPTPPCTRPCSPSPFSPDSPEPISLAIARRLIFAPHMTIPHLSALMCGSSKRHIVNFTYLAARTDDDDGFAPPRTLEFRQHAGTLDPAHIRLWIRFVVGLVRCAWRMGKEYGGEEGYAGEGYPRVENGDGERGGVGELVEFVGGMVAGFGEGF